MRKIRYFGIAAGLGLGVAVAQAKAIDGTVSGDYLEVRSCDVYTGYCVANGEMGLTGKEAIMTWAIRDGAWNGVSLAGLEVVAVVRAACTLGDVRYQPGCGTAILIVDRDASPSQREALTDFVRSSTGRVIQRIEDVVSANIEVELGMCANGGCGRVKADRLVEISTRCLKSGDHLCGNEETYYPPLTEVADARPAFAELAAFRGTGLDVTWETTEKRSAFLATFSR